MEDAVYYQARARTHVRQAGRAILPHVRAIHLQMAQMYRLEAEKLSRSAFRPEAS